MTETLTITLPWPYPTLSPNARAHWRRIAEVKKIARRDAYFAAKAARCQTIQAEFITARITFFPPDRRARDMDNMVASLKASIDGVAEAIGIDDSKWNLQLAPISDPVKLGRVTIQLEWGA
jgi:crossover junction endodeoxyribonuclease RusA